MLCCAVQCCAVLCSAVQCYYMQHHTMLHYAKLERAVLRCVLLCQATLCQAVLYCHSRAFLTLDFHAADGVPEAADMFHTVRAAHLPAVRPAGGPLCPAGPQPAAALRWQEGQHGGQDLGPGQGWGPHPNPFPWYVMCSYPIATIKESEGAASHEQAVLRRRWVRPATN